MRFPDDAIATNVRAYGAVGDGTHDDTAAFRAAIQRTGMIYVPDGTYLITAPLEFPRRRGTASRRILQGQSRDGTIIRLLDRCDRFQDPGNPTPMLLTSRGVAQAFRNGVRDLTFDCGAANPGAIGLEFFASNQGGIDRVRIRSGDPAGIGHTGLMLRGDNGPLLVRNLVVEGFAVGINADANQSATLLDISLAGQTSTGILAGNRTFIRGLDSANAVPAVHATGILTVLMDARLHGGDPAAAAITGDSNLSLEQVAATGYAATVRAADQEVTERTLSRWSRPAAINLDPQAPEPTWTRTRIPATFEEDPARWVSLKSFTPGTVTIERKGRFTRNDWSVALQAAVDSGASTIYLPPGTYDFFTPVRLKPTLRRLIGMESTVANDAQGGHPRFIIEGGGEPLVIERLDSMYGNLEFEHVGARTLCLDSLFFEEILLQPGSGELYLTDVCGAFLSGQRQTIRAHQLNMEYGKGRAANVILSGGHFDLFGLKTEGSLTKVALSAGGHLDATAYLLANRVPNPNPMLTVEPGCSAVVRVCEQVIRKAPFEIILRVAEGEQVTLEVKHTDVPLLGDAASVPLLIKPAPR